MSVPKQCYAYVMNILKKKKNEKEISRKAMESSDWSTENREEIYITLDSIEHWHLNQKISILWEINKK